MKHLNIVNLQKGILIIFAGFIALSFYSSRVLAEYFPFSNASSEEFEKGFSENKGLTTEEKNETEKDKLSIGGSLQMEWYHYGRDPDKASSSISAPSTLWTYFDAKLKNDIRGYIKGRLTQDPTLNPDEINPITGKNYEVTTSSLDEMKLMFNLKKRVFMTVGKQKIKWGSGRFWNPSDIVNTIKRDAFRAEDERPGVSLIKGHIPWEAMNFYLIAIEEGVNKSDKAGWALRSEIPLASSELSLSVSGRKERKNLYALDYSFALGDFDFYIEGRYSKGSDKPFYRTSAASLPLPYEVYYEEKDIHNVVAGLSYEYKYSDVDSVTVQFEYFNNEEGYENTDNYSWVILNRAYEPFYLSKRYAMGMIYLPKPGSWNDWNFSLINVANLTDQSSLLRLDTTLLAQQDLLCTFSLGYHYGDSSGELKAGGQSLDTWVMLKVNF